MVVCKSISLVLLQFMGIALFLLIPSATPLIFNFSSFTTGNDTKTLFLEGDTYVDNHSINLCLINSSGSMGRATYAEPFLLRQNTTGKLTDFTSHFTFEIEVLDMKSSADGFVFFLAPNGSLLNRERGVGGCLGLPALSFNESINASRNEYPFVAVEFDIYRNFNDDYIEDPSYMHVGIDVNYPKSIRTAPWNGGLADGRSNSAWITYNSSSYNLSVAFTDYGEGGVQRISHLNCKIDLTKYLPDLVIVGFSGFTRASRMALPKINSWSFSTEPLPVLSRPAKNKNVGLKIGISIGIGGCAILVGGIVMGWLIMCKKHRKMGEGISDEDPIVNDHDFNIEEFDKGTGPRNFTYSDLAEATNDFEEGGKLGEGGFGGVYKGFIKDLNTFVAVKKIEKGSKQGLKEYAAEVRIISRLRHRNLVQLIGWCHERRLLLVYEFMPNGSLDAHLFREENLLSWEMRYKIAQGLASGLFYLHEGWEQCVLHRDIKSSNIMLDSNFNAKLGDFGLARLVDHGKISQTTIVAGTRGYMSLEYVTTGKASKHSDVYSFGIVALEIACGRKPIDLDLENSRVDLLEWVWGLYGEGKIIEAADQKLCGDFDEKEMKCLMMVGLWCAHPDYNMRPSVHQAIQVLNFVVEWPVLPLEMPMSTFPQPTRSRSMPSATDAGSERGKTESSSYGNRSTYSSECTPSVITNTHPTTKSQ